MEKLGFHTQPFTSEIPTDRRLKFDHLEAEADALRRIVVARRSAALIAPAGAGKTVVLRTLESSLPQARYSCHYIKVTDVSARDMYREIAYAVGVKPAGTHAALVRAIQGHFTRSTDTDGVRPVLLIDEAHDLRLKTLSLLKILTNFKMDSRLVVSIILAGQPSLKALLYRPGHEEIRRRPAHCGEIRLMSREESVRYVEHRVNISGASKSPFDNDAVETLFELSRGNMGAIDLLAHKALEHATDLGHETIGTEDVVAGRKSLWI